MAAKTCLFDIGRVLVEWHQEALIAKVSAHLPEDEQEKLQGLFSEWNKEWDRRSFSVLLPETQDAYPQYAAVIQSYADHWLDAGLGAVMDGTVKIMERLKAKGHRLIAASNFASDTFDWARSSGRLDFVDLFDKMHISGQINIIKPDPAFFETLLTSYDVDPKESIFIDDLQENIDSAKTVGIDGILFTNAENLEQALTQRGYL